MTNASDHIIQLIHSKVRDDQFKRTKESVWSYIPLPLPESSTNCREGQSRSSWTLSEMLGLYDLLFLKNAYTVLLRRDVDECGVNSRLQLLREGQLSRVELLYVLRYSPEGRLHNVEVTGLRKAYFFRRLCRVPVLGFFLRMFRGLMYLPRLQHDLEEIRTQIAVQHGEMVDSIETIVGHQNSHFSKLFEDTSSSTAK